MAVKVSVLCCPHCRGPLYEGIGAALCRTCQLDYPRVDGIVDFAQGAYYDQFDSSQELSEAHLRGLALEDGGAERRIAEFYIPLIRKSAPLAIRVLDSGCGGGRSVDLLREEGYDAWGNDLSQLRKWQWEDRAARNNLVVASSLSLPFPDHFFDVVISSGVIEHIGVKEESAPRYKVTPMADRDEQRLLYLRELGRVLAPGGQLFLDFPNGAFPIDFWHGDSPGMARPHSRAEGFLPAYGEVAALARKAIPGCSIVAISPDRRLQFRQASSHLHGLLLRVPAAGFFKVMRLPGFRWLASSFLNPFMVMRISLPAVLPILDREALSP